VIPRQAWHRIENRGRIPAVVIEVQHGAYLGEDDIVRKQDDYGRVATGGGSAGSGRQAAGSGQRRRASRGGQG
jgi:mannose-1-phosphate guanylyltransferase/mannose-6-phosphate isomerase